MTQTFEIRNCKPPTAYCLSGLSTTLVAMDTTGDGTPDAAMSMMNAKQFDNGSYHSCGYPVRVSFSSDVNDTILVLTCADRPRKMVRLFATDINGNQSYCETFVTVINGAGSLCPAMLNPTINGNISTELHQDVKGAEVNLESNNIIVKMSDGEGNYLFDDVPPGDTYILRPKRDGDDANGISTLDLILIQRHILGHTKLNTPYQKIAADVNNDKKISTADLVQLRKLILGAITDFPNNTSWRFVDKVFAFDDPNDPLSGYIKETYEIPTLNAHMTVDWIGVKIGDVNGSVKANVSNPESEPRTGQSMTLEIEDFHIEKGKWYTTSVRTKSDSEIKGFQFSLNTNGVVLQKVEGIRLEESMIENSYLNVAVSEYSDVPLTFSFIAERDGMLSDMIKIDQRRLVPEAYLGADINVGAINLSWRGQEYIGEDQFTIGQNEPNPWHTTTTVPVVIPTAGDVDIKLMDKTGRLVNQYTTYLSSGKHSIEFGKDFNLTSGVYTLEVKYGGDTKSIKMVRID
jgi:hypothetical protein